MHVLVTGNAGFIGGHLTAALLKRGHAVTGIDIRPDNPQAGVCDCITGDIRDVAAMRLAFSKNGAVDMVVHLAAKHHDFGIMRDEYFSVNEGGMRTILNAAAEAGVKKMIFYSSVAVYGATEADDDTAPAPINDYGQSKLAAEAVIRDWTAKGASRSAVALRPAVVFGVNNYANMYNLMDKVIRRKFVWVGDGSNVKSVVYVENIIEATLFLMDGMRPGFVTYNYSDEPQPTTRSTVELIARHGGVSVPRLRIPRFAARGTGAVLDAVARVSGVNLPITGARITKFCTRTLFKSDKIRRAGFRQPYTLDEGFKRTVEWYLSLRGGPPA
ncbi:MAG: NAD(P)-dependent oxidoreductase [Deltaproteobacteria bacterium]|nr:NAD(P)-dependent oxidoreductase [Deltaproteobacteria bacterium]